MTFAQVEGIVGVLPPSARKHRAWWANDSKVQAEAWQAAGWRVDRVDQVAEWVLFTRGGAGSSRTGVAGYPKRRGVRTLWHLISNQPLVVQVVGGVIAGLLVLVVGLWLQTKPGSQSAGSIAPAPIATPLQVTPPSASATVPEASSVFYKALRTGECLDDQTVRSEGKLPWTTYITVVPCTGSHDGEAVFVGDGWTTAEQYPGPDRLDRQWASFCEKKFEAYVGLAYGSSILSYTGWVPTHEEWLKGDRQLACIAYDPTRPLVGTIEGSRR